MNGLGNTEHLTPAFPKPTEESIRRSWPGMAHFAGTGPSGATCGGCVDWIPGGVSADGIAKPGQCAKYKRLTNKAGPKGIPPSAMACRHYIAKPTKPAAEGAAADAPALA